MPECGSASNALTSGQKLSESQLVLSIRFMIAAEYEAVQIFLHVAQSTENQLAHALLTDIPDEERVHAGEFLRLLKELAPDEEILYREGYAEVEKMIKKFAPQAAE